jgi:hypothetical protein
MRRIASVAGWTRTPLTFYFPIAGGTGSVEPVTDLDLGIHYTIESANYVLQVAGVGSGGNRVLRILKGASTVVASVELAVADATPIGKAIALTVVAADANFEPGDLLSVEWDDAGAVAYTAGAGNLVIGIRSRPQTP